MPGWATAADVEVGVGIDIMYNHHFVEYEEVSNLVKGLQTVYNLSAGKIIPGTLVGSVYLDGKHMCVFRHDSKDDDMCVVNDPTMNVGSIDVNCKTAKITIHWRSHVRSGETKLVVSYEYFTKG